MGLPRHPKKAVVRAMRAEVQGALVLGDTGIAIAKPMKVWQYVLLGLEALRRGRVTLRELQVICGGFVYICMFRRPLLCSLNGVWTFMEDLKAYPPGGSCGITGAGAAGDCKVYGSGPLSADEL